MEYQVICGFCDGSMVQIGLLGTIRWYRCRDCGIERSLTESEIDRAVAFSDVADELTANED